jgi:predicted Zn-dependent protease with MMP-like domain
VVVVQEQLTREQQKEFGMRARSLYGLYEGVPLTERSLWESGTLPDRITIFKAALERDFPTRAALKREIRRTVVHEVAHRFGIDEDRLDELGLG